MIFKTKYKVLRTSMILFCLILIIFFPTSSCKKYNRSVQEYSKVYGGMMNDYGYSVALTKDGGYIIAGTTSSNNGDVTRNHGGADAWVVKLTSDGDTIWQKTFGGTQNDTAFSIIATSDGGFALAGTTTSNDGDVRINQGSEDVWVIKIDAVGNLLWQKTFGGSKRDEATSIAETSDGGLIVAGFTNSNDGDIGIRTHIIPFDALLLKLSGAGTVLWKQVVGCASCSDRYAYGIIASENGEVIFTGKNSSQDIYLVKFSEKGNKIWEQSYGGAKDDRANCLALTLNSDFVFAGSTASNDSYFESARDPKNTSIDICVAKSDSNGKLIWIKTFGGAGTDIARAIVTTTDGGYLIAGETTSTSGDVTLSRGGTDAWVLKVDANGNKLWQQSIGGSGSDIAYGLAEVPRRGYIIIGSSSSNDGDFLHNHGGSDVFVATISNDH